MRGMEDPMEIALLTKTARSATLKLADGGIYNTKEPYRLALNGENVKETDTVVTSLFGLKRDGRSGDGGGKLFLPHGL